MGWMKRSLAFAACLLVGSVVFTALPKAAPAPNAGNDVRLPDGGVETTTVPIVHRRIHYVGSLFAKFGNDAIIGGYVGDSYNDPEDSVIGHDAQFEYPAQSRNELLFGGSLWVGGIVGGDTLVSTGLRPGSGIGYEFNSFEKMIETSDPITGRQTFTAHYSDTLVLPWVKDELSLMPHHPLGLDVIQRSHAFSIPPYDRLVIVEYTIRNISTELIRRAYVGVFADADVGNVLNPPIGHEPSRDDLAGYLRDVGAAYVIDNDGDPTLASTDREGPNAPEELRWGASASRSAFAMALLELEPPPSDTAFNWFATDYNLIAWGPSHIDSDTGTTGLLGGDVYRYLAMSNREIDYDQLWSATDKTSQGWRPPLDFSLSRNLAKGLDTRILLSFGPYDLAPGDSVRAAFVLLPGDSVHEQPADFANYFNASDPQPFYNHLDFGDLRNNLALARESYASGLTLPGAPPASLMVKIANDSIVQCLWPPAPFAGATGYRVYRRLTGGAVWNLMVELGSGLNYWEDSSVTIGDTYEYAVSALYRAGLETGKVRSAPITPGKTPVQPVLTAKTHATAIRLNWTVPPLADGLAPVRYVNIYRRAEDEGQPTRIGRFPYSPPVPGLISTAHGLLPPNSTPQSAHVGRPTIFDPIPVSIPPYDDKTVAAGTLYFYSASVTNALGVEGDRSAELPALTMAMDRPGLVILHTRADNYLDLVDGYLIREFYGEWARRHGFDTVSLDFELPAPQREFGLTHPFLSYYRAIVLVAEDYDNLFPENWDGDSLGQRNSLHDRLEDYMLAGGGVVFIVRNCRMSTQMDGGRLLKQYCGIEGTITENPTPLNTGPIRFVAAHFEQATSLVQPFPSLTGDSSAAWNFHYLHDYPTAGRGNVPGVGAIKSVNPRAQVLYTYTLQPLDTSFFDGRPVGAHFLTDSTKTVYFNFPLSLMKMPQSWQALSAAVHDVGGDTTWVTREIEIDLTARIVNWLYRANATPPNPTWDLNHDGVIDVRDVVASTKRIRIDDR